MPLGATLALPLSGSAQLTCGPTPVRYGDALNPWGDILAIARAWCVAKRHAKLVIGVMYAGPGGPSQTSRLPEGTQFNAHRVYGDTRYPYLATNWELSWRHPESPWGQRVHVFDKR